MHDLMGDGMGEGLGDLVRVVNRLVQRENPPLLDQHPNIHSLDELEGNVCNAAVLARVVDLNHAFMIQSGGGLGLVPKAEQNLAIGGLLGREDFQGDNPGEGGVPGAKHHPHPATANAFQ